MEHEFFCFSWNWFKCTFWYLLSHLSSLLAFLNSKICIKYRKHWKSYVSFQLFGQIGLIWGVAQNIKHADKIILSADLFIYLFKPSCLFQFKENIHLHILAFRFICNYLYQIQRCSMLLLVFPNILYDCCKLADDILLVMCSKSWTLLPMQLNI